MTQVLLQDLWFNDATDPTDALAVPVFIDSSRSAAAAGEVRDYAGGVQRAVSGASDRVTWSPRLGYLSVPDAENLFARRRRVQWVRDPAGGKVAAVFYEPTLTLAGLLHTPRYGLVQHALVTLTLTAVPLQEVR